MHNHLSIDPIYMLRAFGGYFVTLLIVRIMGKRSIGELGPFDFVLMASIGDVMAFMMVERKVPFHDGVLVIATLASLELILSKITIKSQKMAKIIEGEPTVLIEGGKLIRENLEKEKISYEDVRKELRGYGLEDESVVEKMTIESCGQFSVILKEEEGPVTKKDLGIHGEGKTSQYIDERFSQVEKEINRLNTTINNLIIELRNNNK
ncbi:hypothetical protein DUF421 [Gottschalkia acidurici 9a]|uniref:YetF C-terminal domain-containing protein n=1 Tax=Gottschalkia acidurici (strain ATCC 7906 / DSM 604 / BCRC 14475 / CIP 104303 / KCTC 5404 / NCIMB 10678 / 9a) TaxID=1128398 RepID=K0AYS3_GOTA9|nr:YetF domain-containing protein [Gottschalkia acidurici]AFS77932.1 hypothetical protein DUF421 [Gottschalkia acidurici 9a]